MANDYQFLPKLHGLRGLAVLSVVLYHFYENYFPCGFLGVDLFFVLSGYLVTKSIFKINSQPGGAEERISISEFYLRRIARIIPMLFISILFTIVVVSIFTPAAELTNQLETFFSAAIGISNIQFYFNSGNYFAISQKFNFFTQTWSLGVEEQFYLIFSMFLLILSKTRNTKNFRVLLLCLLGITTIASMVLLLTAIQKEISFNARFYLPFYRWWEIGMGACIYLVRSPLQTIMRSHQLINRKNENITLFLILIIIFSPFLVKNNYYQAAINMMLVVLGCTLTLFSNENTNSISEKILRSTVLQFLGSISYSLYLIHWIVVVFIKHSFGLNFITALLGILFSIFLSNITSELIEKKLKNYFIRKPKITFLIFFIIFITSFIGFMTVKRFTIDQNPFYLGNYIKADIEKWGEELKCHGAIDMEKMSNPYKECLKPDRENGKKTVFLTGDSHAMQLYFMLEESFPKEKYQLKYINTETEDDIYNFIKNVKTLENERPQVFEHLLRYSQRGDFVVLTFAAYRLGEFLDHGINSKPIWKYYLKELTIKGVNIILINDSPLFSTSSSIEVCIIQSQVFNNFKDCEMPLSLALERRMNQDVFFNYFINGSSVKNFDLIPQLCDEKVCKKYRNNKLLYFDASHINKSTSKMLSAPFKVFLQNEYNIN